MSGFTSELALPISDSFIIGGRIRSTQYGFFYVHRGKDSSTMGLDASSREHAEKINLDEELRLDVAITADGHEAPVDVPSTIFLTGATVVRKFAPHADLRRDFWVPFC